MEGASEDEIVHKQIGVQTEPINLGNDPSLVKTHGGMQVAS